jgi:hypothetical protein
MLGHVTNRNCHTGTVSGMSDLLAPLPDQPVALPQEMETLRLLQQNDIAEDMRQKALAGLHKQLSQRGSRRTPPEMADAVADVIIAAEKGGSKNLARDACALLEVIDIYPDNLTNLVRATKDFFDDNLVKSVSRALSDTTENTMMDMAIALVGGTLALDKSGASFLSAIAPLLSSENAGRVALAHAIDQASRADDDKHAPVVFASFAKCLTEPKALQGVFDQLFDNAQHLQSNYPCIGRMKTLSAFVMHAPPAIATAIKPAHCITIAEKWHETLKGWAGILYTYERDNLAARAKSKPYFESLEVLLKHNPASANNDFKELLMTSYEQISTKLSIFNRDFYKFRGQHQRLNDIIDTAPAVTENARQLAMLSPALPVLAAERPVPPPRSADDIIAALPPQSPQSIRDAFTAAAKYSTFHTVGQELVAAVPDIAQAALRNAVQAPACAGHCGI